jgi:hypothetical protein
MAPKTGSLLPHRNPAIEGHRFRSLTEALDTTTAQEAAGLSHVWRVGRIRAQPHPGAHPSGPRRRAPSRPHRRSPAKLTDDDIEAAKAMLGNPYIAVPKSHTVLVCLQRRSIGTSQPRELPRPQTLEERLTLDRTIASPPLAKICSLYPAKIIITPNSKRRRLTAYPAQTMDYSRTGLMPILLFAAALFTAPSGFAQSISVGGAVLQTIDAKSALEQQLDTVLRGHTNLTTSIGSVHLSVPFNGPYLVSTRIAAISNVTTGDPIKQDIPLLQTDDIFAIPNCSDVQQQVTRHVSLTQYSGYSTTVTNAVATTNSSTNTDSFTLKISVPVINEDGTTSESSSNTRSVTVTATNARTDNESTQIADTFDLPINVPSHTVVEAKAHEIVATYDVPFSADVTVDGDLNRFNGPATLNYPNGATTASGVLSPVARTLTVKGFVRSFNTARGQEAFTQRAATPNYCTLQ